MVESHDHYVDEGIDDDEDDKTLKVYTIKKDVSLASYGKTFLLGIYGFFFSIVFHRNLIYDVQNDLEFCQSPTCSRMLRVFTGT
jgi:hypothetical protein